MALHYYFSQLISSKAAFVKEVTKRTTESHGDVGAVFLERSTWPFFHLYAWFHSLINWSNSDTRDDGRRCWWAHPILFCHREEARPQLRWTDGIKRDGWRRREGNGGSWREALKVLRYPWDSCLLGSREGPADAHVLSPSLITTDTHAEGQECKMSKHFNCRHTLASSKSLSH